VRQPYGITTRYYWNKQKRLKSIKTYAGREILKTERFYWGKEGRLRSHVLFAEKDSPKLARVYHYDSYGNVLKECLYGRFTEDSGALRIENGLPHHESCDEITTKYTYSDDGFNLKTSECDPQGNYTFYEYVKGTNLLKAKLSCEQKEIRKREFFDYDKNAIMIEHIVDDGSSHDKHNLKHVTERHINRITPRTERPHFGEPEVIEEYYLEDDKEILLSKTKNHFNDKGFISKKTISNDTQTSYEYDYDDIGRLTYSKDPLGQEIYYSYNSAGLLASKRGPRQDVSWHYTYDKAGRLKEVCEEQEHGLRLITTYEYDLLSRKVSETNPQGQSTRYKYDTLNRITEITYPITYDHEGDKVSPSKQYSYKNLGMEVTETDENNHKTHITYNALGKITSQTFADGTKLRYTYDAKGRLNRYYSNDQTIDYTYHYDASDRITKVTNNLTNASTKRKYNAFGEIISETLETGLKLHYSHDKAGRVQELTLPDNSKIGYKYSPTFLESIKRIKGGEEIYRHKITSRDLSGHIQSCLLPQNAGTITYNYDKLNRRTKTIHDKFKEEALSFDPVGNLLELQTGDDHRSFRYDFLSQLIEEKGQTSHTYSYDSLYNRLSQDDRPYRVNSLHSVLSDSKRNFTYDHRGNRTSQDNISYKYDALDRLIKVRIGDKTITYTYDAFNRRLTKSDGTNYLYALDNEIGTVNSDGQITELRLLGEGLGAEIGAAVTIELANTLYIPLHDRQGNVTTLLDTQGQVVDRYRYDAFGNETIHSRKTTNPWSFSSKRVDEETGLINFGRRYYDPTLGKWLTQDPLGLKAGPNLYAYVVNNPMTKIDLYGLFAVEFERMNQLSGSSGYRNEAAGFSRSDRSSGEIREISHEKTSRPNFPFLPSYNSQNENRSTLSDIWENVKEKTPGMLHDGLEFADKLSFAIMLIPFPATRNAGIGIKTFASSAKTLLPISHSQAVTGTVKSATHLVHATNTLLKQAASTTRSVVKSQLGTGHGEDFVNLASAKRTLHIIFGDTTGGGHLWPGAPGKSPFPATWSPDKIMHIVSDVTTDPSIEWIAIPSRGLQRFKAVGIREGVKIQTIIEPLGEGIITGYPTK